MGTSPRTSGSISAGGLIVSPDERASEAGAGVLRDGGNAVDAAIAASAMLCVVAPHQASLGADGAAMVWPPGADAPLVLSGAGDGPAVPQMWGRLLERHGTLGLEPLMAAAAAAARDGWVVGPGVAEALAREAERLGRDDDVWRLWPSLKRGMTLRNPELAATLAGIGRSGFGGFQFGELAGAVAAALDRRDGQGAAADRLRSYRLRWETPAATSEGEARSYVSGPDGPSVACGVCARDETGLLVAIVLGFRHGFGSAVLVAGAGVLLGDGPAGAIAMLARGGRPWAALAAPDRAAAAQVVARLRAGDGAGAAVAAPRVAGGGRPLVEVTHPDARTLLRDTPGARPMPFGAPAFGQVEALAETRSGRWDGGADPRTDGAAVDV